MPGNVTGRVKVKAPDRAHRGLHLTPTPILAKLCRYLLTHVTIMFTEPTLLFYQQEPRVIFVRLLPKSPLSNLRYVPRFLFIDLNEQFIIL